MLLAFDVRFMTETKDKKKHVIQRKEYKYDSVRNIKLYIAKFHQGSEHNFFQKLTFVNFLEEQKVSG